MAFSDEQYKTIAAAWNDPNLSAAQKQAQMTQFGVGVQDIQKATGLDTNAVAKGLYTGQDFGGLHYDSSGNLTGTDWGGPTAKTVVGPSPFTMVGPGPTAVGPGPTAVGPGPSAVTAGPTTTTQPFNLAGLQQTTPWVVDPKTQTVAGQVETLMAKDGPLMQQARTRALQAANASGQLNSTMAASGAEDSMARTALQIAAPDAATYASAAKSNTDAMNTFAGLNNSSVYDMAKINAQTTAAKDIAGLEAQYKSLTQGSASATSILNSMQSSLDKLYANSDITDETVRTNMANSIKQNASASLKLIGAIATDLDLSKYIDEIFTLG